MGKYSDVLANLAQVPTTLTDPSEQSTELQGMERLRQSIAADNKVDEESWTKTSELGTVKGDVKQTTAAAVSGVSRTAGYLPQIPLGVANAALISSISDQDKKDLALVEYWDSTGKPDTKEITEARSRINTNRLKPADFMNATNNPLAPMGNPYQDMGSYVPDGLGPTTAEKAKVITKNQETAKAIDKFFNVSSIVNPTEKDELASDLGDVYDNSVDQVKLGVDELFSGDVMSGIANISSGTSKMVVGGVATAVTSPRALATYITESALPNLAVAAVSPLGLAMVNAGYSVDIYNKSVEEFVEREGRLPDTAENTAMLSISASAGLVSQVADKSLVKLPSASGLAKATTSKASSKLAKSAAVNTAKLVGGATVKEGLEESYQTAVETGLGSLNPEGVKGKEVFTAGIIGAASGGTIQAVKTAGVEAVESYKEAEASARKEVNARKDLKKGAEDYVESEFSYEALEGASPEAQAKIALNADKVAKTPEQKARNVENLARTKSQISEQILDMTEEVYAEGNAGNIEKAKEIHAETVKMTNSLASLQKTIDKLTPEVTLNEDEQTQEIEAANEGSSDSTERVFNSFVRSPDSMDADTALEFANNPNNSLSDAQRNILKNHADWVETVTSTDEVSKNVMYGGFNKDTGQYFFGIQNFRDTLISAITAGNKDLATKTGKGLMDFATLHSTKAKAVYGAYQDLLVGSKEKADAVLGTYNIKLYKSSGKLVNTIINEAKMLNEAVKSASELFRKGFDTKAKPSTPATTETSAQQTDAEPVTTKKESVPQTKEPKAKTTKVTEPKASKKPKGNPNQKTLDLEPEVKKDAVPEQNEEPKVPEQTVTESVSDSIVQQPVVEGGTPTDTAEETEGSTIFSEDEGSVQSSALDNLPEDIDDFPAENISFKQVTEGTISSNKFKAGGSISLFNSNPKVLDLVTSKEDLENFVTEHAISDGNYKSFTHMRNFTKSFAKSFLSLYKPKPAKYSHESPLGNFDVDDKLPDALARAVGVAAYDWLATSAQSSLYASEKEIVAVVPRDAPWDTVKPEVMTALQAQGVTYKTVAENIGKKALNLLNIKMVEDVAFVEEQSKVALALGTQALAVLEDNGLVESRLTAITGNDLEAITFDVGNKTNPAKGTSLYTSVRPVVDTKAKKKDTLIPRVANVKKASTMYPDLLEDFFSTPSSDPYPSLKPTRVPKMMLRTGQKVPKKALKVLNDYSSRKYKVKQNILKPFMALDRDFRELLSGYEYIHDSDGNRLVHVDLEESVDSKNNNIVTAMDSMEAWNANLEEREADGFYLQHVMWSNGRVGEVGKISLQNSKIHRHMYGLDEWDTVVNLEDTTSVNDFMLGIAEAFDVATDKQNNQTSLDQVNELLKDPVYVKAIAAVSLLSEGTRTSAKAKAAIEAAVKKAGTKIHAFEGLVALSEYVKAAEQGKTEFTTNLIREVDGVTNAYAFGLMQYSPSLNGEGKENLRRVGIFVDNEYESYGDYRATGIEDIYQSVVGSWEDSVISAREKKEKSWQKRQVNNMLALLGSLTETDSNGVSRVTKRARNAVKDGVMTALYGAGESSIAKGLANFVYEDTHARLKKLAETSDVKGAQELVKTINAAVGETWIQPFHIKNVNTVMETPMPLAYKNKFITAATFALGKPLFSGIKTRFGSVMHTTQLVTETMRDLNNMYRLMYNDLVSSYYGDKETGVTLDFTKQVLKQLTPITPILTSSMSDTQDLDQGVFVGKYGDETNYHKSHRFTLNFTKPINGKNTLHSYAKSFDIRDLGSKPAPVATHNLDSSVMIDALAGHKVNNIFDAIIGGVGNIGSAAEGINKAFYDKNRDYSIVDETIKSAKRYNKYLAKLAAQEYPTLDKESAITRYSQKNKVTEIDLSELKETRRYLDKHRKELYGRITYVTQYNLEGHGYKVPKKDAGDPDKKVKETASNKPRDAEEVTKGSAPDSETLDPKSFNKHEAVNRMTVLDKYDMLKDVGNVKEDPAHSAYLRGLIFKQFTKVMRPFKLHMSDVVGSDNLGSTNGVDMYMVYSNTGEVPHRSGILGSGIKMSTQEVLAHELTHNVLTTALESPDNRKYYKRTVKMWESAKNQIKPEDFLDSSYSKKDPDYKEALAEAKQKWDYIFTPRALAKSTKTNPITGETEQVSRSNHIHEFVAYGLTNKNFRKALSKVTMEKAKKDVTFLQRLTDLFNLSVDWVQTVMSGGNFKHIDKRLDALVSNLLRIDNESAGAIKKHLDSLENRANDKLAGYIKKGLVKVSELGLVKNSKYKLVQGAGLAARIVGKDNSEAVMSVMQDVIDGVRSSRQGVLRSLVREASGTTKKNAMYHDLSLVKNKEIDMARKAITDAVSENLETNFETELTDDYKESITKAIIRTDVAAIDDYFGTDKTMELLKDSTKAEEMISEIKNKLKESTNFHFYRNHAENLGYFMITGKSALKSGAILNASNIANKFFTGEAKPQDASKWVNDIDALASLYAVKYANSKALRNVADLVTKEVKDNPNNGISYTISQHKNLKSKSMQDNFKGSEELFIKGYTYDILDSSVRVKVGTEADADEFSRQGYTRRIYPLKRDAVDSNRTPEYLYVSRVGGDNEYLAGILAIDSKKAKGSEYMDLRLDADASTLKEAMGKKEKVYEAKTKLFQATNKPIDLPSLIYSEKENKNILTPVPTADGTAKAYRYIMGSNEKDELLNRDNNFSTILGRMAGSSLSKSRAKDMNRKLIKSLKTDYMNTKNKGIFIEISPKSEDPELREMWARIPYETRQYARKAFSGNRVFIRPEVIDLVFGYPKRTILEPFLKDSADRSITGDFFVKTMQILLGKNAAKILGVSERVIQEGVGWAKDAIVTKLGTVTVGNVVSNMIVLRTMGISSKDVLKGTQQAYLEAFRYKKDAQALAKAELDLQNKTLTSDKKKELKSKIAELNEALHVNPVAELVDAGVLQSIVEDVNVNKDPFAYTSRLGKRLEEFTKKIPEPVRIAGEYALIARNTNLYSLMSNAAQISDFAARYVQYKHLTGKGMDKKLAVRKVMDTFINYSLPSHRNMQYASDIGVVMFHKYLARIQKIIFQLFKENPANTLANIAIQNLIGDLPDIIDSSILGGTSPLSRITNPLELVGAADNILTLEAVKTVL